MSFHEFFFIQNIKKFRQIIVKLTIEYDSKISKGLHLDVPQYITRPASIRYVMARTTSVSYNNKKFSCMYPIQTNYCKMCLKFESLRPR